MNVDEWADNGCENSVRVNGCADEPPYYAVPWVSGPFVDLMTELWCEECVKDDPTLTIDGDEAVWDTSDNDKIPVDEVRGSDISGIMSADQLA